MLIFGKKKRPRKLAQIFARKLVILWDTLLLVTFIHPDSKFLLIAKADILIQAPRMPRWSDHVRTTKISAHIFRTTYWVLEFFSLAMKDVFVFHTPWNKESARVKKLVITKICSIHGVDLRACRVTVLKCAPWKYVPKSCKPYFEF